MPAPLDVRPWKRYGHHRLYLATVDGDPVGWIDVTTGARTLDRPGFEAAADAALATYLAGSTGVAPPAPAAGPEPAAPPASSAPAAVVAPAPERGTTGRRRRSRADDDLTARAPGASLAGIAGATATSRIGRLFGRRPSRWELGATGEQAVGRRLDRLAGSAHWLRLHSIPLPGGGDIDHLVLGPAGVFTVNTKHHPDAEINVGTTTVFVNRRPVGYLEKAFAEAQRAGRALSAATGDTVRVQPLVVCHGQRRLRRWLGARPYGVKVLPSGRLTWWLRAQGWAPGRLSPTRVERLYALAASRRTWSRAE